MILELIGYAASVLVAISLTMSSILRLRLINLAGAILFTVYGVLIEAWPVAAVNFFIVGVNIFYLLRIRRTREYFRILDVAPASEYLRHFVDLYGAEMRRHNPTFALPIQPDDIAVFVLRDVVPAGLFVGNPAGDGVLRVRADYVLPGYRDLKVAQFLFDRSAGFFRERGVRTLQATAGTKEHARYLERIGFRRTPADPAMFVKGI